MVVKRKFRFCDLHHTYITGVYLHYCCVVTKCFGTGTWPGFTTIFNTRKLGKCGGSASHTGVTEVVTCMEVTGVLKVGFNSEFPDVILLMY